MQLLCWGLREGRIASNPLAAWRSPRGEPKRRRQPPTTWEIAKLLDSSPPDPADIWRVFLATGLRRGELAAGILGRLRLRLAEGPQTDAARRFVFLGRRGNAWQGKRLAVWFERCVRAAGLRSDIDTHTLRHTVTTQLVATGTDIKTVAAILGHSSERVTLDVYTHRVEANARAATAAMEDPVLPGTARRVRGASGTWCVRSPDSVARRCDWARGIHDW